MGIMGSTVIKHMVSLVLRDTGKLSPKCHPQNCMITFASVDTMDGKMSLKSFHFKTCVCVYVCVQESALTNRDTHIYIHVTLFTPLHFLAFEQFIS